MSTITIDTTNLRGETAPLYHRYPNQTQSQPAYIEIDEDGNVGADFAGKIGNAQTFAVWHRRTLQWNVRPEVRGDLLADFLESPEIVALLERVHAGHSVEWDGNNHVGRLDDDAHEALDAVEEAIQDQLYGDDGCVAVYGVAEWLFDNGSLADCWTDQPLATAVSEVEAGAQSEGAHLDGDVEYALLDEAEHLFDRQPDRLNRVHVDALLADGRISAEDAAEWIEEHQSA
jgi:hypothetical protein